MATAHVTVHLFRLEASAANSRSLEDVVNQIEQDPLEDRIRKAGMGRVRLDHIQKIRHRGETQRRVWLLDFTKLRDTHGPGKAKRNTPVIDLALDDDDFFGEEAAALFLPDSGYLLIQYNHYGVRPSTMADYLSHYLTNEANSFELIVCLDADAERKFARQRLIRKFEIGVDLTRIRAVDRANGDALMQAVQAAARMEGLKMNITISMGTDRGFLHHGKQVVSRFLRANTEAVTSAVVSGRATANSQTEVVDLIHEKLAYGENLTVGHGKRLPVEDRFGMLQRALATWTSRIDQ